MAALRSFPALEPYAQLPCALVGIGGRALDLWIGRQTRAHQDVDVAILRDDQNQLHEVFGEWELYYATTDHRLVSYRSDRWLEEPLHGVWVRPASDAAWLCEFLLNEHENQQWVYRRNPAVRKPLAEVGLTALGRVPILVPEIVLLYKAHELTEKDEADFRSGFPKRPSSLDTEPEGLAVGVCWL